MHKPARKQGRYVTVLSSPLFTCELTRWPRPPTLCSYAPADRTRHRISPLLTRGLVHWSHSRLTRQVGTASVSGWCDAEDRARSKELSGRAPAKAGSDRPRTVVVIRDDRYPVSNRAPHAIRRWFRLPCAVKGGPSSKAPRTTSR